MFKPGLSHGCELHPKRYVLRMTYGLVMIASNRKTAVQVCSPLPHYCGMSLKAFQQEWRACIIKSPTVSEALAPMRSVVAGREKMSTPTPENLDWLGHCLHDPSEQQCGAEGMTISIWLSLMSVSQSRVRYMFNSGNAGDSGVSAQLDAHGALLGASVSIVESDWELMLDPTSYELGKQLKTVMTFYMPLNVAH